MTLVYEVHLERRAERDLRRLSPSDFARVIDEIKALSEETRPPGCRKIAGSVRDWRIRVGDYRIIYEVCDSTKVVRVMQVRHRSEAYRLK